MKVKLIFKFVEKPIPKYIFIAKDKTKFYVAQREPYYGGCGSLNGSKLYATLWEAIAEAIYQVLSLKSEDVVVLVYDSKYVQDIIDAFESQGAECSIEVIK